MGYYFDDVIAIANARLSIVDLSTGQQPIGDATNRYWIVFNGEIYNYKELGAELETLGYRFTSRSDTEVLLYAWIAWGEASLRKLNGAFAFCIFDTKERSLTLARDRFGKRPLYYIKDQQGLVFASEVKCLLAYEPFRFEFDNEQLASIFCVWTPLEDQSGYKHIQQVPAGALLVCKGDSLRVSRYAPLELELDHAPLQVSEAAAAELVRETLTESVRLRLRGDVEVGTYLSGGLDSAIVSRLVVENRSAALKSFSIGFEEQEFDESADQKLMSSFLGTDHTELRISEKDIVDAFPTALLHAEIPVFRTAFVPMFLLSKLVSNHGIKVVLTGEGADEAFLGYDIFKETLLRQEWQVLDLASKQDRLAHLYPYMRRFSGYDQTALVGLFNQFSRGVASTFFSHELRFHNSKLAGRLLKSTGDVLRNLSIQVQASHEQYGSLSVIQKAQWLEYKTLLVGYLLSTQGDRMSLAHGVENRCPFLDPNVVALGAATNLVFNDGSDEKYILKKAFAGQLPERMMTKPKQPYRAPDASAFVKRSPDYLHLIRSEDELKKIDHLDSKFCLALVNKVLSKAPEKLSQAENQAFLFLLSLALLHRTFVQRTAASPQSIDSLLVKTVDGRTCQ